MTTRKWSEIKAIKSGRPAYTAVAERDGRFWFLRVVGRDGLFTQTVRLDQAEAMVRDLIATYDDLAPDSFDVRIRARVDDETDAAVEALTHARFVEGIASSLQRALAVELVREKGLTLRDAAQVLELSFQRVAQLVDEHDQGPGSSVVGAMELLEQFMRPAVTFRAGDAVRDVADVERRVRDKLGREIVVRNAQGRFVDKAAPKVAAARATRRPVSR